MRFWPGRSVYEGLLPLFVKHARIQQLVHDLCVRIFYAEWGWAFVSETIEIF